MDVCHRSVSRIADPANPMSGALRQECAGGVDLDGHGVIDEAAEPSVLATKAQECPVTGAGADESCRVEGGVGERGRGLQVEGTL